MFNFHHLDAVRPFMLQAINESHSEDKLYHSSYFKTKPDPIYVDLLTQAAGGYNEVWLEQQLNGHRLFKSHTLVTMAKTGKTFERAVPVTAAQTLADGQFNRHYMQGLCKYARTIEKTHVTVYRAHSRYEPRDESVRLIGTQIHIDDLEFQLREPDCYSTCGVLQPNSGLSVHL